MELKFSKDKFINDNLTGNPIIDDLIINLDFINELDGKIVESFYNCNLNETILFVRQKHDRNNFIVKKQWINK